MFSANSVIYWDVLLGDYIYQSPFSMNVRKLMEFIIQRVTNRKDMGYGGGYGGDYSGYGGGGVSTFKIPRS